MILLPQQFQALVYHFFSGWVFALTWSGMNRLTWHYRRHFVRWVIETLRVDFGEAAFSLHLRQPAPAADPIALLQGQIEREQSRLERVRNAYEAGIDTLEEYRQNKEKLSATLEQLRRQLIRLQTQESPQQETSRLPLCREQPLLPFLADPAVSEVEKNRLLRALIRQVRFDRQNNCIEIHYYL